MNLLITGADGFVGSNLCRELGNDFVLTKLVGPRTNPDAEQGIFAIDLGNKQQVAEFVEGQSGKVFHAVIHLAFILCRPGDWQNYIYFDGNNEITKNMISLCETLDIENIINFSSLAVYPNISGEYTEDSDINPSVNTECLYGLAKFNSEMLFSYMLKERTVINLRMTQCYGPGMQTDRLVGVFLQELEEKNVISVFGNGERISNFIHIDDVCEAVSRVLHTPAAGTYNLACNENISYHELAKKLLNLHGNSSSRIVKVDQGTKAKVLINGSRFEDQFGFACKKQDFDFQMKGRV